MPFPYYGSKRRKIDTLPAPPPGTDVIVEPFGGSAAYGLHHRPRRLIIAEKDPEIQMVWQWLLYEASPQRLNDIYQMLLPKETKKDVRHLPLSDAERIFVRLNCCGLFKGVVTCYQTYAQNVKPFSYTTEVLAYVKEHVELHIDAMDAVDDAPDGSLFFIDPPYVDTKAKYNSVRGNFKHKDTNEKMLALIEDVVDVAAAKGTVFWTYGSDARERFPWAPWTVVERRATPTRNKGVTRDRVEHFAIVWPRSPESAAALSSRSEGPRAANAS